jgi:predicted nucleotidyltransferase
MVDLPLDAIHDLCRRYRVKELSLFGSAARGDARPDSDLDFLVEFEPDARIGLIAFIGLRQDLEDAIGRKVDLVPRGGLRPLIRDAVLSDARVLYAA